MSEINKNPNGNVFFASSNSYEGFISYFESVFSPTKFRRRFIIKGGPGTGKSTFLKKICAFAQKENLTYETIACSSDSKSIDGVILKEGKTSVCVLDGTAPHTMEASYPGVIDELLDFGKLWDESMLISRRKEIVEYNKQKKAAYAKAYSHLGVSSVFDRNIKAEAGKIFNCSDAEDKCDMLCRELFSEGEHTREIRLISSFSKDGYKTLDTLYDISDRIFNVSGSLFSAQIFLKILRSKLEKTSLDYLFSPSPLDKQEIEAIYMPKTKTAVIINAKRTDEMINSDEYLPAKFFEENEKDINLSDKSKEAFLGFAKDSLSLASEYHFKLEDIYSSTVDFSGMVEYFEKATEKIKNIFS